MSNQPEDYNLDPLDPHAYAKARAEHLRKQLGSNSETDPEFAPLDLGDQKARAASQQLRDTIASQGLDAERPLKFSVSIAGRSVAIELKEENGVWSCNMPVEIEPQVWEWRRLQTTEGYDALLGMINARLRSGPTIRSLSPEQELRLARMCVTKNKFALAACLEEYLQIRLGLGVDDSTLDDLVIFQ